MFKKSTISNLAVFSIEHRSRLFRSVRQSVLFFGLIIMFLFISWTSMGQQATNITIEPVPSDPNSLKFNWTNGGGAGRIVIIKNLTGVFTPEDGTDIAGLGFSSDFSAASDLDPGAGEVKGVYSGTAATITVTNLPPNTPYYIKVYEWSGTSTSPTYDLTATATNPRGFTFFTSDGTFNVPLNISSVTVQALGGGGGGGGADGNTSHTRAGGGGAGGSYTLSASTGVTGGANISVTIGDGGSGGLGGNDADQDDTPADGTKDGVGSAGGTSDFGGLVSAIGGAGGGAGIPSNETGDASSTTTGTTFNGGGGAEAPGDGSNATESGAGGGSAGTTGSGTAASGSTAGTGGTGGGGDGAPGITSAGNASIVGVDATELGGGGSGGLDKFADALAAHGGDGAPGYVIVSFTDNTAPAGYSVNIDQAIINAGNESALSFTFAGAEVGAIYHYSIDDTNGGTPSITGNGTIGTATDQITDIDVSSLDDDVLTLTVHLTDNAGNQGSDATDNVTKDTSLPTGYSVSIDQALINAGNQAALSFTFAGAEIGTDYDYSIDDANGGTPAIVGSGTIVTAIDQITGIDVSSLDDGTLTLTVYLTDPQGNQGTDVTDNVSKDLIAPAGYTVSIDQTSINAGNQAALSFTFAGAEIGTDYDYSIDDANGGTPALTGNGTIVTATDQITGIDVSTLDDGALTLTVFLSDPAGNQGSDATDNVSKDVVIPTGYTVSIDPSFINSGNQTALSFTFAGAEVGVDYDYSIDDANGGTLPVTGNGTVATATDQITGIDVSSLDDGTLTLTVHLTDNAGNQGADATDNISKDANDPTGYTVSIDPSFINSGNQTALSFTFAGAEAGADYDYSIDDANGGTPAVTGSGTIVTATDQISGINVSSLDDGTLTLTVFLTDPQGNQGADVTDNVTKDVIAPAGYTVSIDQAFINVGNQTALSFTFAGAEVGVGYDYSIDDANGGTPAVTGSGTIATATDQITGINVSSLDDGTLTLTVYLTDPQGNQGSNAIDNLIKDTAIPVFSSTAPAGGALVNTTNISYTLSETITSGTITWTEVGGGALDINSPHTQNLAGSELNSGAHNNITLTNNPALVSGAPYTIAFNGADAAGNVATTVSNTPVTFDDTPPALSPDEMTFNENGAGAETIVFTISEELNLAEGASVTGFTTSGGSIASAIYSGKNTTNTITLTSAAPSQWSTGTTVSYSAGNVVDLAGNAMTNIINHAVILNVVNLSAGSIALTSFKSDDPNTFSVVFLKDVSSGTTIKFTDNGWTSANTLRTTEQTFTWTADADYFAGTEIVFTGNSTGGNPGTITASHGNITPAGVGSEVLISSSQGDQILAYQGSSTAPTFLAAIQFNNTVWDANATDDQTSALPAGLTNGTHALAVGDVDNGAYDIATGVTGSVVSLLSDINNSANWTTHGNPGNVTFPAAGLTNYILPPDLISVNPLSPVNGSVVPGNLPNLTIKFDDNVIAGVTTGNDIALRLDNGTLVASWNVGTPSVSIAGATVTVNTGALALTNGQVYEIDVAPRAFLNADGNGNTSIVGETQWKFTGDALKPTLNPVTITSSLGNASNARVGETITLAFTASEPLSALPVVAFRSGGVPVTNTVTVTDLGSNQYTATYVTDANDTQGAITFTVDFVDGPGNAGVQVTATTNGSFVNFDKTLPTATVSVSHAAVSTNTAALTITVTFSESMDTGVDPTITLAPANANFSAGTGVWSTVVNPNDRFTIVYTHDLTAEEVAATTASANSGSDLAGNVQTAAGTSSAFVIDTERPTVTSITRANANPTNATAVAYTVVFSEAVTNINAADFTPILVSTESGIPSAGSVSGISTSDNITFTVTVSGVAGDGDIRLDVLGTAFVTDAYGNDITANFTTGEAYTIDQTAPIVDDITLPDANPNNTGSVDFNIVFSEDVVSSGVDVSDFTLYGTASGGTASITNVSGSGTSYTVTVSNISLTGTLGLNLVDDNTIEDVSGNSLGGPLANDGNASSATTYEIILPEPQNHVTAFTVGTTTTTSIQLTWTDAVGTPTPTGYLITAERSGGVATPPSDGTPVLDQTNLVGNTTGYLNVSAGLQTATFSNMLSGVDYTFYIYPYTNSGANIDYKIGAPVPTDNGSTTTGETSAIALNSTPVPINSILDGNPATDKAIVMEFSIFDDGQDPIADNVMTLHPNFVSQESVTFNLSEQLTLAEGASVTGFTSSTGAIASARYSGKGTTNTITLTSGADGQWTSGTTISYSGAGNVEFLTLGKLQPIVDHPLVAVSDFVDQTFNANGSYNVPAGVTKIVVEAWGAGGSGGPWDSFYGGGSQGGGGGAYSRSLLTVNPGEVYNVTVGTGGAAVNFSSSCCIPGNPGGSSSFVGPGGTVAADGGEGGEGGTYFAYYGANYNGAFSAGHFGLGGQATDGIGDVKYSGGDGGNGGSNLATNSGTGPFPFTLNDAGGGGSSAGYMQNGNSGSAGAIGTCAGCFSDGGLAPTLGGAGGRGYQNANGLSGSMPGGGGGGTGDAFFSGAGANGRVRIVRSNATASAGLSGWDADNAPFKFSDLVITQGTGNSTELSNWQDIIAGAELSDGTNIVPGIINSTNITFSSIPADDPSDAGYIEDASASASKKDYTLRIWLRDDLNNSLAAGVDGLNLAFSIDPGGVSYNDVSNGNQTSSRLTSTHPIVESGANEIDVVATQLDFTTSPAPNQLVLTDVTSVSAAPDNSTVPVVRARDANGNTDLDYIATISLTNIGTIPTAPTSVSMNAGTAVFPTFQYQNAGDGTLTAETSTLAANGLAPSDGISTPVTVDFSALSTLAVVSTDVISTSQYFAIPFEFSITDDGGAGGDGSPTRITQLTITKKASADPIPDWREILDVGNVNGFGPAAIRDGSDSYLNVTVTVDEDAIIFSNMMATPNNPDVSGLIGDGQTKTYSLYLYFKPAFGGTLPETVDHFNFDFEVDPGNILLDAQSSGFNPAQLAISSGPIDVDVDADQLHFTTQPPADVLVNADLVTSPVVEAVDRVLPSSTAPYFPYGNRDLDFTDAATITNTGNLGMSNMPAAFVSGVLTFPAGFQYTQTGDGTLTVNAAGVSSSASSTNVNVRVGVSGTITAGGETEPGSMLSTDDTDPEKVRVFDFTITDDAGAEDDGNPMLITQIRITQQVAPNNTITNWADAIAVAELYDVDDGNTVTGTVNATDITFASMITPGSAGHIEDDASKTYELRIYLRTSLGGSLPSDIDGLKFGFEVLAGNIDTDPEGSSLISTEGEDSGTGTEVTVDATTLTFITPVASTTASLNVPFAVALEAQDENGNLDLDFNASITNVSNASGASMEGNGITIGSAGSGIEYGVTQFSGGEFTFPPTFQFTTGDNEDDVTLTVDAGGITTDPPVPNIELSSSFESLLVLDAGFVPTADIPYINYQDISTQATSFELARFELFDGDGITMPFTPDTDGAPTNIDNITFSITNPDNIRSLAIYSGSTLIQSKDNADFVTGGSTTVTFDNLSASVVAPDNGNFIMTVRASFFDTDAEITDNDVIQLHVENVTQDGGSQFNDTDPGNIGGIIGGAISDPNVKIEVTATSLDFVQSPAAFEGINKLITEPEVRARDANGIVDVDQTGPGSEGDITTPAITGAGISDNSKQFAAGIMDFTGFQYTSVGDGTLSVSAKNVLGATITGTSSHVDVIHVGASIATGGVFVNSLAGGAEKKVIFGATFKAPYTVAAQPKLEQFVISFVTSGTIIGVFNNIKVFESVNRTFEPGQDTDVTTAGIGALLTLAAKSVTVDFTPGTPRDLNAASNNELTYFLMVDVDPSANASTPLIQPRLEDGGEGTVTDANILTSNGSATAAVIGTNFNFAAVLAPTIVSSFPARGQLNVDPTQPHIELVYSVPVWTLDGKVLLYDYTTKELVQPLSALNGLYAGSTGATAGTPANPLKFSLPPLLPDHLYYIVIPSGQFNGQSATDNVGIMDESEIVSPGFSYSDVLYFKTANPNPPLLLTTPAAPAAPAPNGVNNVPLSGATISGIFDQHGKAYFMVVPQGSPPPSNDQIKGTAVYLPIPVRGEIEVNQINSISQFGLINATLAPSTSYDVWICAESYSSKKETTEVRTAISTSGPYGGSASGFAVGGAGPTLSFSTVASMPPGVALNQPILQVCSNSYQVLNEPIIITEGSAGDFNTSGSERSFNLLLPSGFQFDDSRTLGIPNHGTVNLYGADFVPGSGFLSYINNSILRISYKSNGSGSLDKIAISGLRVIGISSAIGQIVRLGGDALPTIPDNTVFADISAFDAGEFDFTNSYSETEYPGRPEPITVIPNNFNDPQFTVELIPVNPPGDYGSSIFSGSGVQVNQLSLTSVSLGTPFNVVVSHTDNNGCVSTTPVQYTVYDHEKAIGGLNTKYCIENTNFPGPAPEGIETININFDNNPTSYMMSLRAGVPSTASPTQIIQNTPEWNSILKESFTDSTTHIGLTVDFFDYVFDFEPLLNADSTPGIANPYSHFIRETPIQKNIFYAGGSLGLVEFTAEYQGRVNTQLEFPLKQNVEFFVPAMPIVEVDEINQSALDTLDVLNPVISNLPPIDPRRSNKGTPVFCEQGGKINITGYPRAEGASTGFFVLTDAETGDTLYFKPAVIVPGVVDNGNGTASIDPALFTNDNRDIRIIYNYKQDLSPCESNGSQIIRIEPNPVASYTTSAYTCTGTQIDFLDASSIPAPFAIDSLAWSFDDQNASAEDNISDLQTPGHTFTQPGTYDVTLTAFSSFNCASKIFTIPIVVGAVPDVKFKFAGVSTADDITFESLSTVAPPNLTPSSPIIASLRWNYGDGSTGTNNNVSHKYASAGIYDVQLKVTSTVGCRDSLTRSVVVVPKQMATGASALEEKFTVDNGGWQFVSDSLSTSPASWEWGLPSGGMISDTSNVWTTSLTGPYNKLEKSALYSAVYDISQLERPMISFNSFVQMEQSDGIVLQYSTDSLNIADSKKQWITLGSFSENIPTGVDWYNGANLASKPGNQDLGFYGWTTQPDPDNDGIAEWMESKHTLSLVEGDRTRLVFRFSLASVNDNPQLDGFALDNVRIGNRTRIVLVENFTNLGNDTRDGSNRIIEAVESDSLEVFPRGITGTAVVKINYHVSFPQKDPFNMDNAQDPGARALYYNISQTPRARMDGLQPEGATLFSEWGNTYYGTQSLKLADAELTPSITHNIDGTISVAVTVKALKELSSKTILNIAIIEKAIDIAGLSADRQQLVKTGETDFNFVLKKLLPNAAGTRFNEVLPYLATRTFPDEGTFTWTGGMPLYTPTDDLALVVFLQDEDSKEVFQAEIVDLNDPSIVTGIEDLNTSFNVYPNPADKELIVTLPHVPTQSTIIQMFDQMGKVVNEGYFDAGQSTKTISTEDFAGGVYVIQVRSEKGVLRRKVMVVHRN